MAAGTPATDLLRHCEERSDEAIQYRKAKLLDCFASLAMTYRYDDRMSSSRRPSVFNNFFTALEAATSPLLA
jgi:hypothetical protein